MAWHKRTGWKRRPVQSAWSRRVPSGWPRNASGWHRTPPSQARRGTSAR
jgi:hypothetical protein